MTVSADPRPEVTGLAFRALPDSGTARCEMGQDGVPVIRLPGCMELSALADPAVARAYPEAWHRPGRVPLLPAGLKAVLNLCSSPDLCAGGLADLDAALPPGVAVLNHPRAVMMARRDVATSVFTQIAGLLVPRAHRFLADSPLAFRAAFEGQGFHYPVTVQVAGDDTGQTMHHVAAESDWPGLLRGRWGGRHHLMIQSAAGRTPWRLLLGMAGGVGHAEVFNVGPRALPAQDPPPRDVMGRFIHALMHGARQCLPLDCWSLVVALDPLRPVLDRVMVGLPSPVSAASRVPGDVALRRVRKVLDGAVAELVANPASWRTDAASLPPVAKMRHRATA